MKKENCLIHLVDYRYCSSGTVRQESSWTLLNPILENNSVGARGWRVLNPHKVLIFPSVHAVLFEPIDHLVRQHFVTRRTSSVVGTGKVTDDRETQTLGVVKKKKIDN